MMKSFNDEENTIKMENPSQEQTRSEKRKMRKRNKQKGDATEEHDSVLKSPGPKRMFPIWARILLVIALIVLSLLAGLMFGYGVIGDGKATDALKWETFQHIFDLINKE
jgi:hypothetical protein